MTQINIKAINLVNKTSMQPVGPTQQHGKFFISIQNSVQFYHKISKATNFLNKHQNDQFDPTAKQLGEQFVH